MTNSSAIAAKVGKKCNGKHRHIMLIGGRAKEAQHYPPDLCKAICEGLVEQLCKDGVKKLKTDSRKIKQLSRAVPPTRQQRLRQIEELNSLMHSEEGTWDAVRGGWLDPSW